MFAQQKLFIGYKMLQFQFSASDKIHAERYMVMPRHSNHPEVTSPNSLWKAIQNFRVLISVALKHL